MRLPQFFSNPFVGLIGTVCSVISIPLAILLYWNSIKERDLTYYVYPIRTTVLQSGYATGLRVLHNNQEVKTDVTAVQLAIWNNGKEPIFKENILSQIKIVTRPAVPILEARIQKQNRKVIDFVVDNSLLREGVALLSWRLLEHSDGVIIQLLYAGPVDTEVALDGVILGQRTISRLVPLPATKSRAAKRVEQNRDSSIRDWFLVSPGLFGYSHYAK